MFLKDSYRNLDFKFDRSAMKVRTQLFFILTALILLLTGHACFGFDDGDFQYWSAVDFSIDINKDWKFTFEEEFRFGDDAGELYHHYSDLGFVYKGLADWIDVGINYRQIFERKDSESEWRQENRPHINITLKGKLFELDLSDRSRFEYRDRQDSKDLWRYRNKLAIKIPLKFTSLKLQPYLADEVFINFDEEDFNRNRFYAGITFDLSKNIKGDLYYLRQSSESDGKWNDLNVIGSKVKFLF